MFNVWNWAINWTKTGQWIIRIAHTLGISWSLALDLTGGEKLTFWSLLWDLLLTMKWILFAIELHGSFVYLRTSNTSSLGELMRAYHTFFYCMRYTLFRDILMDFVVKYDAQGLNMLQEQKGSSQIQRRRKQSKCTSFNKNFNRYGELDHHCPERHYR